MQVHNSFGPDGRIWERILSLVPAPVLALSATIADPAAFGGWLQGLEARRGRDMPECIVRDWHPAETREGPAHTHTHAASAPAPPAQVYGERYNDLAYYVWEPPSADLAPERVTAHKAAEIADAPAAAVAIVAEEIGGDDSDDDDDIDDAVPAPVAVAAPAPLEDDDAAADAKAAAPKEKLPELVSAAIHASETTKSRIVPLNTAKLLHRVALDPTAAMPNLALLPEDCLELYDALVTQLKEVRARVKVGGGCACSLLPWE